MEENLERKVAEDKNKLIIIMILSLIISLLIGYIAYDKLLKPKDSDNEKVVKEPINNDLPSSSSSKDITSEDENNESENTVRELDINSTLVKSLNYPKMSSLHDDFLAVTWHYNDINISTMSNELKLENANDHSQWVIEDINNGLGGSIAYISSNDVKNNYLKLFGPDSIFPNANNLKYSENRLLITIICF